MTLRTATRWLVLAVPVGLGLYDLAAYLIAGNDATISRVVLAWAGNFAPLPFAACFGVGVLFGHAWLPQHPDPATDSVPGWKS